MHKRFNIRVYGIWIDGNKVLVNEESVRGLDHTIIKFPGGGLEFGEGTADCLKREWKEELGLDIDIIRHFYTTDFYQPSAFDDSQVISIYYLVRAPAAADLINQVPGERTFWLDLSGVSESAFSLPIDKLIGKMLQEQISTTGTTHLLISAAGL